MSSRFLFLFPFAICAGICLTVSYSIAATDQCPLSFTKLEPGKLHLEQEDEFTIQKRYSDVVRGDNLDREKAQSLLKQLDDLERDATAKMAPRENSVWNNEDFALDRKIQSIKGTRKEIELKLHPPKPVPYIPHPESDSDDYLTNPANPLYRSFHPE